MPSGPPQEQARALLQELEALVPGLKRDLKALPELKWTQELQRLCRLWGFPKVLLGELQEPLAPQMQQEESRTKAEVSFGTRGGWGCNCKVGGIVVRC